MKKHIALLYSLSPHFLRALETLRREHPDGVLTVIVPPSFPQDTLADQADRVVELAPSSVQRRSLRHGLKLIRFLRKEGFDQFTVLFNSPMLVMISVFSGSREKGYISPDGRMHPLSMSFVGLFFRLLGKRIKGQYTYYRIWWHIRLNPIEKELPERKGQKKDSKDSKS